MEDINDQIKKLNSLKNTNFYIHGVSCLYIIIILGWAAPKIQSKGGLLLLIYLAINISINIFFLFKNVKVQPNTKFPDDPDKYYKFQIDRSIISNDISPVILFVPLVFTMIAGYFLNKNQPYVIGSWFYISITTILIIGLWRGFRVRRFLRKEYQRLHGHNFLSFFYF